MINKEGVIQEFETFQEELRKYYDYRNEMQRRDFTSKELEQVTDLRRILVRKSGKYKKLISEITGIENVTIFLGSKEYPTDIWTVGLLANPVIRTPIALGYCIDSVGQTIGKLEDDVNKGIRDEQGELVSEEAPPNKAEIKKPESLINIFDKMHFHSKVIEASRSLFESEHYAQAIFEAFKAVENFVQDKSDEKLYGTKLMEKVFDEEYPIIKVPEAGHYYKDVQRGFKHLFIGAAQAIRNPKAHKKITQKDPHITLQYLGFFSFLLKRIDYWEAGTT